MSAPESPDLAPELVESLLKSLKSWDPRASVPLALDYMEHGDRDALNGFDALARQAPAADQMLTDRYLSPSPDVEALRALADGTLGREFARYLDENELDANLLRESAFIPAHRARGEDVGYLAERGFQLHDLFHVLTGFDTTPLADGPLSAGIVAPGNGCDYRRVGSGATLPVFAGCALGGSLG